MKPYFVELWESINLASVDLLKNVSESNKSAFDTLLPGQTGLAAWGKLAGSSLSAANSIRDIGVSDFNHALRSGAGAQGLDGVAANVEEYGNIVASLATSLTQLQVSAFNGMVSGYANTLRSLGNAASADEIAAVQANFQTELQARLKSSALETLQTVNSLNSGLAAWVETSIARLAESKGADVAAEGEKAVALGQAL